MKRDLSLIRDMLLRIEELTDTKIALDLSDFADLHTDRAVLVFHTCLLIEARFIRGGIIAGKPTDIRIDRLTFTGCDYLDSIRDNDVWHKVCDHLARFGGGAAMATVKALASRLVLNF